MTLLAHASTSRLAPLLLIDDDRSLASLLTEFCVEGGFSMVSALNGEDGIALLRRQSFQLVILDVMMPGIDGFEVLKQVRTWSDVPVLMLTTRGAAVDRIQGLQSGADDYLAKPFEPEELVARIKSILRRVHPAVYASRLTVGDLVLDESERSTHINGTACDLTGAEFGLLKLLLSNPGDAMSREELIPKIFDRQASAFDRSIDNLVNNLRKKLGPHPDGNERIKSVRNIGYIYVMDSRMGRQP